MGVEEEGNDAIGLTHQALWIPCRFCGESLYTLSRQSGLGDFSVMCMECVAMPCCLEDHLPFLVFMENGLPVAFRAQRG